MNSRALILFLLLVTGSLSVHAQAVVATPVAPTVAARAHLLLDFDSGQVLSEHNSMERLEPASLTKLMSAHVVFQELDAGHIKMDDQVLISEKAWRMEGSRTFVEVGKRVPLEVLLMGMVIQSGNDASVALAEHVAGTEEAFAAMMNAHAKRLGMNETHFVNATGLPDPQHYTTARDLAKLAIGTIREFPKYYALYAVKEFTYNKITQHNRNLLLYRDPSVDGMKTGHTASAGYCLVASAKRDGMRLISVLLGTESEKVRAQESLSLLNFGFRFYETKLLHPAGTPLQSVRVWKGEEEEIPAGPGYNLYVTAPRGQFDKVATVVEPDPRATAPIIKGQSIGSILVTFNGQPLVRAPLAAAQDNPEGGFTRSTIDAIKLWLQE